MGTRRSVLVLGIRLLVSTFRVSARFVAKGNRRQGTTLVDNVRRS